MLIHITLRFLLMVTCNCTTANKSSSGKCNKFLNDATVMQLRHLHIINILEIDLSMGINRKDN